MVGFAATVVAMVIGGGVGIASGYFGRWIDTVLMRITDYLLVIPDLVFALVIADIWGPSLFHVIIARHILPDGFVIAIVIVGCFLLGQAIEDALNPR